MLAPVRRTPLVAGVLGALAVLILMLPLGGCGSTDQGIPPGGPDPNGADCEGLLLEESSRGGEAGTDEGFTTVDLIVRRMALRAFAVAAVPLVVGLAAAWFLGRRNGRPSRDDFG